MKVFNFLITLPSVFGVLSVFDDCPVFNSIDELFIENVRKMLNQY